MGLKAGGLFGWRIVIHLIIIRLLPIILINLLLLFLLRLLRIRLLLILLISSSGWGLGLVPQNHSFSNAFLAPRCGGLFPVS